MSQDGRHVVTGSHDNTVAVWDLHTGERLRTLTGYRSGVDSVAVSPDNKLAVSGSHDGTVAVWDLATGWLLRTLTGQLGWVSSVAVSPDGRHTVSGSFEAAVAVWDLHTGKQLARLALDGPVLCLTWHPDDPLIVAGDQGGNLYGLEYHEP